ncbi:MAG TPA: hypothetical protein VHU87_02350 [Rhizomicrobium sp.]|nr:hypothetical protein [Rhizomicrobium sp.]
MSIISGALRAVVLAVGLAVLSGGAALACDNCDRNDGGDGWHHDHVYYDDGRGDRHDGTRDEGYRDRDYRDEAYRDCRSDGCHRYADDCRDNCYRHEDGCHDGCGRRYDSGCHDGCYRRADNYSCYSGRYDCRFEGSGSDERYRERYYDGRSEWSGGGAYGYYGH